MSERITPGQAFQVGKVGAERVFQADLTKDQVQFVLEQKSNELGDGLVELLVQLSSSQVKVITEAPADLREVMEQQVDRLVGVEAYKAVGFSKGTYRDQLMAVVKTFQWRPEWATIGLGQVGLVDYRLSGKFLAKVCGVTCYIDPDECGNYQGVETPDGLMVIQYQSGPKYRDKSPRWCRDYLNGLEQGLVVVEALTVFLYESVEILKDCYMDIPGSMSGYGLVPCLGLWFGEPGLSGYWGAFASPRFGSASRGKCKPSES